MQLVRDLTGTQAAAEQFKHLHLAVAEQLNG
jgi:hypothetical protein